MNSRVYDYSLWFIFCAQNLVVHEKGHVETPGRPLCSMEGSEYSSFHLFLSGETCPTATATFSSANVIHFLSYASESIIAEMTILFEKLYALQAAYNLFCTGLFISYTYIHIFT